MVQQFKEGAGPEVNIRDHFAGSGRIGWYALLAAVLIVPFMLREVSPQLEAYPAVLLPTGAMVAKIGDTEVTYPELDVFAVMKDGSEQRIDPGKFLGDIPVEYLPNLCYRHFGLEPPRYVTHWSNLFGRKRHWTAAERRKAMDWMAARAKATGHPDAEALRFRRSVNTADIRTGKLVGSKVDYVYDLRFQQ